MTRRALLPFLGASLLPRPVEAAPVLGSDEWIEKLNEYNGAANALMVKWNESRGKILDLELWKRMKHLARRAGICQENECPKPNPNPKQQQ